MKKTILEESVARDRHGQGLPCAFCASRTPNIECAGDDVRHIIINDVAVCRRCILVVKQIRKFYEKNYIGKCS